MRKELCVLAGACCSFVAYGQRSMTDSTYTISNVEILGKHKAAMQEQPVQLLGMDVPLKYLPISISRIDAGTLERKHILTMEDAVRFLPGVIQSSDQLGAFKRYSVRGSSDAVITYDGVREERSLLNTMPFADLSAVESIEVIKGPASVLSGHSVMGGVINIVRKKATADFNANASISYGSWEQKESTIGFGGKLLGPVNYRANIHYSNGDGYRDVNAERFSGLFSIGTEITKNGYLETSVSFNDDHYRTDIGGAPTMPGDVYNVSDGKLFAANGERNPLCDYETVYNDNANNRMRHRSLDVVADYHHTFSRWLTFRDRFSFQHYNMDYSCVENVRYRTSTDPIYDWYYTTNKGVKTYIEMDSLRSGSPLCFNPDAHTYTNTAELSGTLFTGGLTHTFKAGWNYTFFDYTNYTGYKTGDVWGPGLNEMVPVVDPHTVRDWWDSKVSAASIRRQVTNSAYLHDVIDINEHWKAMVGLRYDTYRYRTASATIDDGRQHYEEENRTDWKRTRTGAFTYRVGAVYLPIEPLSIYASAASYFKPNTTTYNASYIYLDKNGNEFNPDEDGGEVFKPEKGHQFEVGARYEVGHLFDINASVFYMKKHNVVRTLGTKSIEENGEVVNKSVRAQVGHQVSKGFDFDITVRPVSTLQIVTGLGWSDLRTTASNLDWIPKDADWVTYNEDGTINLRATGVPRTTFYTYADYTIPRGVLKSLSFHLSGTFTDKIYRNIQDNLYDPARYVVDAGVYYTIKEHITLAFNLNNVLNNHYFQSSTRLAKPRNFMATITYHFR